MGRNFATRFFFLTEGVRIALDSVRANKVRAGLTILGIAVGVFVVVAISGAIHGILSQYRATITETNTH